MQYLTEQNLTALISAAWGLCTLVAFIAPKGSRIGQIAAKLGSDLKGHMTPAGKT